MGVIAGRIGRYGKEHLRLEDRLLNEYNQLQARIRAGNKALQVSVYFLVDSQTGDLLVRANDMLAVLSEIVCSSESVKDVHDFLLEVVRVKDTIQADMPPKTV